MKVCFEFEPLIFWDLHSTVSGVYNRWCDMDGPQQLRSSHYCQVRTANSTIPPATWSDVTQFCHIDGRKRIWHKLHQSISGWLEMLLNVVSASIYGQSLHIIQPFTDPLMQFAHTKKMAGFYAISASRDAQVMFTVNTTEEDSFKNLIIKYLKIRRNRLALSPICFFVHHRVGHNQSTIVDWTRIDRFVCLHVEATSNNLIFNKLYRFGLVLYSNWAGFLVKTWQPWSEVS